MGRPPASGQIEVIAVRHGPFWNVSYVAGIPGGTGVVIDPAWDVPSLVEAAARARIGLTHAIVTHGHHDHAHGLADLVTETKARVLVHRADARLLAEVFAGAVETVDDGHEVSLGRTTIRLLHTPGHSPGSLSIYTGRHVFTGDTLMVGRLGRHGAYHGAEQDLHRSAVRLAALPADTVVYPGHDDGPAPFARLAEAFGRGGPALRSL